jgi:nucleotide-binding universal stress UspA family protein
MATLVEAICRRKEIVMNAMQDGVHSPKRIIVGMDFSEPAQYALALAAELARCSEQLAELHVVHVAPTVTVLDPLGSGDLRLSPSLTGGNERVLRQLQDTCGALTESAPTRVGVVPHLLFGDPAAELKGIAHALDADLIIVGAHEDHGWWWHRSLAARLARRAPCSVLTARGKSVDVAGIARAPCDDCLETRRVSAGRIQRCRRHAAEPCSPSLHH